MRTMLVTVRLAGFALWCQPGPAQAKVDYAADVRFAVERIEKACATLLASKKIDWKKATAPLVAEAKKTKTEADHLRLLVRLLARLQDGHAEVRPLERGKGVQVDWPDRSAGPGMFLCKAKNKVWVKTAWAAAAGAGLEPGMEVVTIGGQPALAWLEQRAKDLADLVSFSTPQHAFFYTCHWGLADAPSTRLDVEVVDGGNKKKRTLTFGKANQTPPGPAFAPGELTSRDDVHFGRTATGNGYIHVRRCKETVVAQVDDALQALGDVPGMILDFRGNSGGGFDHDALFGRFIAPGHKWQAGAGYVSAGAHPYAGPVVVIVDATVRSAGETGAGMFKEDGRAYMIGESATAGMASQKTTIELPSKLFALYVSVGSNKARFQDGKGIEGVGVVPHEIVEFDPADLKAKRDTLIARADALLAAFGKSGFPSKVRYVPAENGWGKAK
jgi:hypothetical protein